MKPEMQSRSLLGPVRQPPVDLDGNIRQALETGRNRLLVTGVMFMIAFCALAVRLVDLSVFGPGVDQRFAHAVSPAAPVLARADIVDRNGIILATSLPTASLFADPREVMDADEAAAQLVKVLPDLNQGEVLMRLRAKSSFVWIERNLTPKQQYAVNALGIPGLGFRMGERRVYPHGREAAHVLGLTDVDGRGIAGVEKQFAETLSSGRETLRLSIDLRVQAMLRQELAAAVTEFKAIGAAGIVMDADSGEVIAMVSLPDFDPNLPDSAVGDAIFNRAAKGVYEMGSTFKLFNTAMALDTGTVSLDGGYDASEPIHIARFTISDFHGKNRWLSVPEILVYSSNIGSAKMAIDVGAQAQRFYLDRLGLIHPSTVELPEVGQPQSPDRWGDISTMTISYGHGISVSPLQLTSAVAAVVNGGIRRSPSVLKYRGLELPEGERVLAEDTSDKMRGLMRLVVSRGTGKNAAVPGYLVGGKTGTAEKQGGGGYRDKALISSFVGAFPIDAPRFVVMAMLDEPKGNAATFNYATGGWVAAPVVGRVIGRMAPLFGIAPRKAGDPDDAHIDLSKPRLARAPDGSKQLAAY